jgi:hypothetical protein
VPRYPIWTPVPVGFSASSVSWRPHVSNARIEPIPAAKASRSIDIVCALLVSGSRQYRSEDAHSIRRGESHCRTLLT